MLISRVMIMFVVAMLPCFTQAESLQITLKNAESEPVANAVIYVSAPHSEKNLPKEPVIIDQIDKTFVRPVTVIRPGMSVHFPNHDQIRHHVYSFSPAKNFELPLYKDKTPEPVRFEQAGVVALGCNIHDWMSAYIVVVDSVYTAITNEQGQAVLNMPPGDYQLKIWHSRLKEVAQAPMFSARISAGPSTKADWQIELKGTFKSDARNSWGGFEGGSYP